MQPADVRSPRRNETPPTLGSRNKSLGACVWELLDDARNVPDILARLRTEMGLSTADSFAIERAVAGTIEQFIAAGRVRLVRRGSGGEALVRSRMQVWFEG